jgi:hypothetical protein
VLLSRASTTSDYSRAEAAVVVRGLQAFETLSRGWCDMGAAYVVDRFGRVFTGRAAPGGGAATGRGAPGFDADSLGIAVLAADSTSGPTEAQVTGLVPIIAERLAPAYADPGGTTVLLAGPGSPVHPAGKPVTFQVIGDRGAALSGGRTSGLDERALGALRRRVTAQLHGALVAPTASASELRIGADDELRVTAGVLGSQQWTLVVQDEAGVVVRRLAGTARQS